jgi:lactaldehyde dehydrogenase/glycolaldehyde dehydrogenase
MTTLTLPDLSAPHFVGGRWREAAGPERSVEDPSTGETIASLSDSTSDEVSQAVAAGRSAQADWSVLPAIERGRLLARLAQRIEDESEMLARLLAAEVGKPISQARGEVGVAAEMLRFTSEWARRLNGDVVPSDQSDELITLLRVPLGVVAAICAWNFPIALYARKAGPALLAGNAVVVKPSELTPIGSVALTRLADEAGFPPGVLNLVCGGPETGRALTSDPGVDLISMTGSARAGRQILADAAPNLTRVSLELGGKAPAIVLADADLDAAVAAVAQARHLNAGQVCTAAEVVYVQDGVKAEFTQRYEQAVGELRVGDPLEDLDLGPLASSAQLEKARAAVEQAVAQGARAVVPGDRSVEDKPGFWFVPAVLEDVTQEMAVVAAETFGPVTPIVGVGSLEDAIERANASPYGLSAYVYTTDYRTAMRAARDLDCGEVYVNRGIGEALQAHHSGHKQSGMGGEDGIYGLLRYTQVRSVYHHYG